MSPVKYLILLGLLLLPWMPAWAVDDGAYAGFYQVTYADPEARRELNDSGELILVVKDNKIIEVQYDEEGFVKGKVKYKLKINEKTGELSGYFTEKNRLHKGDRLNLNWRMKGIFVDRYFAGKADIYLTHWNGQVPQGGRIKVASYVFESP